ncbi:MAG: hypothetical protein O7E56_06705, partial [SAR324 cluster bacterium]|nr:hypothetical protein [SAR324 cluster bacterium]
AQAQMRGRALPGMQGRQAALPEATSHNPSRVRNLMLAIHGFTRAQLDAASTGVDAILRGFLSDPAEAMVVKRQAIKALGLYPADENFVFIKTRMAVAPVGLRRLYMLSLAGFDDGKHDEIVGMLGNMLADPDVGTRHVAVSLAARLRPSTQLRSALLAHLSDEPEPGLRAAIGRVLSR